MTEIVEHQTIWYPGIYAPRTDGEYNSLVADVEIDTIIELVQQRAHDDGEWAIKSGHVGENEDKMRRFMAFVSEEKNVRQCVEHIYAEKQEKHRTVDWVCRELANASKVMVR